LKWNEWSWEARKIYGDGNDIDEELRLRDVRPTLK